MLLVLFAVLLISQTVEKGVSSTVFDGRVCLYFIREGGHIMCSFAKVGTSGNFNAGSCSIGCTKDKRFVRLPDGVCGTTGALVDSSSHVESGERRLQLDKTFTYFMGSRDHRNIVMLGKKLKSCKPEVLEKLVKWKLELEEMVKLKK
uniref:Putative secreted protein n=1 Tax=Ixodes ricinus TaxID=34613 RepID=A0A6B0UVD2_IXORI